MYIREKTVHFLKIKNVILSFVAVFLIAVSAASIVSLTAYYFGDWETIITAKAIPGVIRGIIIGIIFLIYASISRDMISDAYFYSSYFEGNLYGNIKYSDLAAITGKKIQAVQEQMHLFIRIYMKNFTIKNIDGTEQIELFSKKLTCECRHCGAAIEKKEYFTGVCPYCGSYDIFAKVLTDHRFYSISTQIPENRKTPDFYASEHLKQKKAVSLTGLCFGLCVFVIALLGCITQISNYNDQDYLTQVLLSGKSYSSFELIKSDIIGNIIWIIVLILAMIPLIYAAGIRLRYIFTTNACSEFFAKHKKPFVKIVSLSALGNKKYRIKSVKAAICHHYLVNCSFENHDGEMEIALARKIVKDKCRTCGAPISGAADENYKCRYCGNMIMGVIHKAD